MAYVAPTVRSAGDAVTAADYNIMVNDVIDLNIARVPVAAIDAFAGSTAPTGWLLCDGSAVSQTTYAALYAVITSTYDVTAPGAGNFRVPDLRGRAVAGKDNMGGTAANRITATSGITGTTLAATGGSEKLQNHTHTQWTLNTTGSSGNAAAWAGSTVPRSDPNQYGVTFGGGQTSTHNQAEGLSQNMPPTIILNYIIKT